MTHRVDKNRTGFIEESYNAYSNLLDKPSEALLKAAKIGDLQMVKDLYSQGHSLMTKDGSGQTVLHYAARHGHKDIVKYLLGCAPSALINVKDNLMGQTALHKAASYRWRSICCMLVAAGAGLDITDHRGLTARLLALQADDHELAAYLESQERFHMFDLETVV